MTTGYVLLVVGLAVAAVGVALGWWLRGGAASHCHDCGRPVLPLCWPCHRRRSTVPPRWATQPTAAQQLATQPLDSRLREPQP